MQTRAMRSLCTVLLCALLLAGCGLFFPESVPPAPPAPPAWRTALYNVAVQNLTAEGSLAATSIKLHHSRMGRPVLEISYKDPAAARALVAVWQLTSENPVQVYYGDATFAGISCAGGNPVFYEWTSEEDMPASLLYWEYAGGKQPLYEVRFQDNKTLFYTHADGQTYSWAEWQRIKQTYALSYICEPLTLPGENSILPEDAALVRLQEFLLQSYSPALPEDTPAWAGRMAAMLRCQWEFPYVADGQADAENWALTLYPALYEGGAPIVAQPTGDGQGKIYALWADYSEVMPYNEAMQTSFYQTENGQALAAVSDEYTCTWYTVDKSGLTLLFSDGALFAENAWQAYCNGEVESFGGTAAGGEEAKAARTWRQEKQAAALADFGYGRLIAVQGTPLSQLPTGGGWPPLEAALVEALAAYGA